MDKVFAETFPSGQVLADVTALTLVNNTSKTVDVLVPTDCLWVLEQIKITNPDNVNRAVTVRLYKEAAKTNLIAGLGAVTLATTVTLLLPNNTPAADTTVDSNIRGRVLGGGFTIELGWATGGASAGGTDADGIVVMYRKLSLS